MDTSALNLAHYQHRRAESLLRAGRFDDALECHQKASSLLEKAMTLTKVTKAVESLQLQHDYHVRQKDIISLKKTHFEKYRKSVENQRRKMASRCAKETTTVLGEGTESSSSKAESLHFALYRNMEEQDSLLELLLHAASRDKSNDKSVEEKPGGSTDSTSPLEITELSGTKFPKDDKTVIEELQIHNQVLRTLVEKLVHEWEATYSENEVLKTRIQELEAQVDKHENEKKKLQGVTDSGSSPFDFSPASVLSPETGFVPERELPQLAPLELPNFDFTSVFKRKTSNEQ